ncbi:MAG: hypothetical protein EOP84_09850 [Verrucomicrobiaceae bacterium]|nr:MAG: hypothetical protein EOP84_09850 [Verrucomicrobiaceae bacterium]
MMQNEYGAAPVATNETTVTIRGGDEREEQSGSSGVPLEKAISPEFPPLTVEDVEALRAGNTTDERIREIAAKFAGKYKKKEKVKKSDLAALLAAKKNWLLEQSGGKPLFSGFVAGTLCVRAGFCPPFRRANSFGDYLGGHGHQLPRVKINGVNYYDVNFIGKSSEEKAAREAYLNRTPIEVLRELVAHIEDVDEPTPFPGKTLS